VERPFFDTNILVYSFDQSEPVKQGQAQALIERSIEVRNGVISYQVVQEFLNVALRRFKRILPAAEAQTFLTRVLMPMCEVFPDGRLYAEGITIAEETGWGFYDSLIVASAAAARCTLLWSEDLQDGRVVRGVEIRNPFLARSPRCLSRNGDPRFDEVVPVID
jgi:predicted nucleic acid-binding protein